MRIATIKEFRDRATVYLRGREPLLITRRGKVAGIYVPLDNADDLPLDLRKDLQTALAQALRQALEAKGVTEHEVLEDFERTRRQGQT